jgi:hypothetical protein
MVATRLSTEGSSVRPVSSGESPPLRRLVRLESNGGWRASRAAVPPAGNVIAIPASCGAA